MDLLARKIHTVIETNLPECVGELDKQAQGKRAYQLVKHVTGKKDNTRENYTYELHNDWYGYQTIVIKGTKGFIRLALTPLFEEIK